MRNATLTQIAGLRLLVGFLGEQSQFNWWSSSFFTANSRAFLSPVFSKTAFIAQWQGVKEAASRVHDEHIGVGAVYHLFRLPEPIEQTLFSSLQDQAFTDRMSIRVQNQETALENLASAPSRLKIRVTSVIQSGKTKGQVHNHPKIKIWQSTSLIEGTPELQRYTMVLGSV